MTKLTDTQAIILSAASQRPGNRILPLPERLKGGAAQKVVAGLISRGLAAECDAGRDDPVWRESDGIAVTLVATEAALASIGVEPGSAVVGRTEAQEGQSEAEPGAATTVPPGPARARRAATGRRFGPAPSRRSSPPC